jgi:hypothetical protein
MHLQVVPFSYTRYHAVTLNLRSTLFLSGAAILSLSGRWRASVAIFIGAARWVSEAAFGERDGCQRQRYKLVDDLRRECIYRVDSTGKCRWHDLEAGYQAEPLGLKSRMLRSEGSPRFGEVNPAKTSSHEGFSSSTCYQTLYLKTYFGWAVTQGRILRASIPSREVEKKQKKEKSGLKKGRNCQNGSKKAPNRKKGPRQIGLKLKYVSFRCLLMIHAQRPPKSMNFVVRLIRHADLPPKLKDSTFRLMRIVTSVGPLRRPGA